MCDSEEGDHQSLLGVENLHLHHVEDETGADLASSSRFRLRWSSISEIWNQNILVLAGVEAKVLRAAPIWAQYDCKFITGNPKVI